MAGPATLITHPVALCAYVLSLVFGLLAKMWNSKRNTSLNRQLFRLAVFVSVTALVGGLTLAWYHTSRTARSGQPAAKIVKPAATQSTTGDQSPNLQNTGNVTIQYGTPPNPPEKSLEKKK